RGARHRPRALLLLHRQLQRPAAARAGVGRAGGQPGHAAGALRRQGGLGGADVVSEANAADWLTPAVWRLIELALEEDLGRGDVTTEAIFGDDERPAVARVIAEEPLVLCGGAIF